MYPPSIEPGTSCGVRIHYSIRSPTAASQRACACVLGDVCACVLGDVCACVLGDVCVRVCLVMCARVCLVVCVCAW